MLIFKHQFKGVFFLNIVFLLSLVVGCSSGKYEGGRLDFPISKIKHSNQSSPTVAPLPWELWELGKNLEGVEINSPYIRQGDRDLSNGLRLRALENYLNAQRSQLTLTKADRAAVVLRVASTYLAADKTAEALKVLSQYFQELGLTPAAVDPRFGVIFAFAYGRNFDFEQSLAWFSQVARTREVSGQYRSIAESGLRVLMRAIPDDRLLEMPQQWDQDMLIRSLIGEERSRRAAGGRVEPNINILAMGVAGAVNPSAISSAAVTVAVGVLLPLSGKYAALGQATHNGIELALEGQRNLGLEDQALPPVVRLEVRDSGMLTTQAIEQTRSLISSAGAKVILGPLLAEHALAVRQLAIENHTPMLTLSKNKNFVASTETLRLGATAESQINSLLEACESILSIKRLAIVYPIATGGDEFSEIFRQGLANRGMQLVYEAAYQPGSSEDLIKAAKEIESTGAQAVFFPDTLLQATRFFGALRADFRKKIRPLGVGNWDNQGQLTNSSTVMDGAIFVSPFFAQSQRTVVKKFIESYQAKFSKAPDFLAAQGFDALTLIQEIVRKQQLQQSSWASAARMIDVYDGLTGRISLRDDGEFERLFSVVELRSGTLRELQEVAAPSFAAYGADVQQVNKDALMR